MQNTNTQQPYRDFILCCEYDGSRDDSWVAFTLNGEHSVNIRTRARTEAEAARKVKRFIENQYCKAADIVSFYPGQHGFGWWYELHYDYVLQNQAQQIRTGIVSTDDIEAFCRDDSLHNKNN